MAAQEKNKEGTLNKAPSGKPSKEKVLFSWKAPERAYKERNREYYVTLVAIGGVFGVILLLIEGFMPVILLIAIGFLFYVLSTVKPRKIEYKITDLGIDIAGSKTGWDSFTRFWFSKRYDDIIIILETYSLPGRMELVVNKGDTEKVRDAVSKYLPEDEANKAFIERSADWLASKLPENE